MLMFYLYLINFKNPTRNWSIFLILKLQQKKFSRFRLVLSFFVFCFIHFLFSWSDSFLGFLVARFSFSVFVAKKRKNEKNEKNEKHETSMRCLGDWWYVLNHFWWKSGNLTFCFFVLFCILRKRHLLVFSWTFVTFLHLE
jgi:hypothetical protein